MVNVMYDTMKVKSNFFRYISKGAKNFKALVIDYKNVTKIRSENKYPVFVLFYNNTSLPVRKYRMTTNMLFLNLIPCTTKLKIGL